eukprot:6190314-Pleurochrysis_carterae.AAC.1
MINGSTQTIILGCYVDDLFVLYADDSPESLYTSFTTDLSARWNVEDEGPVSDLLNIDIATDADCVILKQEKYIRHLLDTYLPDGVPTSFHRDHAPAADDLPKLVDAARTIKERGTAPDAALRTAYQSLVGALLYCSTQTRPDIAYAVGMLCRTMSCPTLDMLNAAKRVLCYLSHHRSVGLRYARVDNQPLTGFSDSDWATRHSTSGHVFLYGKAAITWSSKKQPTVALSSCEAEIIAASEAAKEATYLRSLMKELGENIDDATPLHLDNKSAIDL